MTRETKARFCIECFGTGKQIRFGTTMGIMPFITTLDREKEKVRRDSALVSAFIAELGWEGYIDYVWGFSTKATKTDETCTFCLGEGVVMVPPRSSKWAENGQDWLDEFLNHLRRPDDWSPDDINAEDFGE